MTTFNPESDVIAALIKYPKLYNKLELHPHMFSNKDYSEILEFFKEKGTADIKDLYEESQKNNLRITPSEIIDLKNRDMIFAGRFKKYQSSVLDNFKVSITNNAAQDYLNNQIDITTLENVIKTNKELSISERSQKSETINQVLQGLSEDTRTIHPTGLRNLDFKIEGFEKGQFNLIGARPSAGKTALALQFGINYARAGKRVTFVSLETDRVKIARRILASMSGVRLEKFKTKDLMTIEEKTKVNESAAEFLEMDFEIFDKNNITPQTIRSIIARDTEKQNVVIIDYIQLMKLGGAFKDRRLEVEEISRQLKIVAKETGAIIISLAQLSRGVESRNDKRPMMSDLKEAGGLEQDADVIMLLYRDDYYNKPAEVDFNGKSDVECIIAKNKDGEVGKVDMEFYKPTQRFF
ncbi:damage-inducible protein [Macrococcoides bohemicum]|uniref:DnaB helicase C-terminal domain-containing protein n=1 Tax=Macrococcoides bohemicum TaxID=1903056 RepID=UPI00105A32D6|nr:DnaB helicase C-terminal domain-containing protein [Macrococcus bohemicus]TDL39421.1 damage-inducible protein [Macrococcus bohemicus]